MTGRTAPRERDRSLVAAAENQTGVALTREVTVEVGPGGGLRSLQLNERALRLGGDRLAETIVRLVDVATAQANRRAQCAAPGADLDALGLGVDDRLAEAIEETTPDTWMR